MLRLRKKRISLPENAERNSVNLTSTSKSDGDSYGHLPFTLADEGSYGPLPFTNNVEMRVSRFRKQEKSFEIKANDLESADLIGSGSFGKVFRYKDQPFSEVVQRDVAGRTLPSRY